MPIEYGAPVPVPAETTPMPEARLGALADAARESVDSAASVGLGSAPNFLGVYWAVMHRRKEDYETMKWLRPAVVKVMDGGPPDYAWVQQHLPSDTLILAREWALSEQKSDMLRDPIGTGKRHANEWDAKQRYLGFDRTRTLVLGINEPNVWDAGVPAALTKYTIAFLDECKRLGLRAGALQFSVGWPNNTGPDTPPDWSPFAGVEQAILRGNHALVTHEYWAKGGPRELWGWWGGRTLRCPWQVPIVIGECGIDVYVQDGTVSRHLRGWQPWVSAERYADELVEYTRLMATDPRVVGVCPYLWDYAANEWQSFDLFPAYPQMLNRAQATVVGNVPRNSAKPPVVVIEPPETPTASTDFIFPVEGFPISQHYGETGINYGPAYRAHMGIDYATPLGTPVKAIADGSVAYTGYDDFYGNYVRVWHKKDAICSFYAHLHRTNIVIGQEVKQGQVIATSGNSGKNTTGPHLHFEIRLMTGIHTYEFVTGMDRAQVDPVGFFAGYRRGRG